MEKPMHHYYLTGLLLAFCAISSCAQASSAEHASSATTKVDTIKSNKILSSDRNDYKTYLHSTHKFEVSKDHYIIIENSQPKGGPYYSAKGSTYGHGMFWNRIINTTGSAIAVQISFPSDSILIESKEDAYFKLFLPTEKMTLDLVNQFDYGIENLEAIFESSSGELQSINTIIQPGAEYLFYTALLIRLSDNGAIRTEYELKDGKLFYNFHERLSGDLQVPCGYIQVIE